MPKKRLTITLDEEETISLENYALEIKRSKSFVLNELIKRYLPKTTLVEKKTSTKMASDLEELEDLFNL